LGVEVCVGVDEAGGYPTTVCIQLVGALGIDLTDADDSAVSDSDIAAPRRGSGSIDNEAAANDEVVDHVDFPGITAARDLGLADSVSEVARLLRDGRVGLASHRAQSCPVRLRLLDV